MGNFFKKDPAPRKKPKRLRARSAKRAAVYEERRPFVTEQLRLRPRCEAGPRIVACDTVPKGYAGCAGESVALHEPLTRARAPGPETILDPVNSVTVCAGDCHMFIHRNVAWSESVGLLNRSTS